MSSRSISYIFNGSSCPESADFGYVHGTAPAVGRVKMDGNINIPLGKWISIKIGWSTFIGKVIQTEEIKNEDFGEVNSITAVDWRDRLHDNFIFAAYNMQEGDGRYWHLFFEDFSTNKKIWLSKELEQVDYASVQEHDDLNLIKLTSQKTLLSSATILNILAKNVNFNFRWFADPSVINMLRTTRPLNLDWQTGATAAEAIQEILDHSNLRFTCYGMDIMHITLRGVSHSSFANNFLQNYGDICKMEASEGSKGEELLGRGDRVIVLGEPNKYQYTFAAIPNWNPAWTWELCRSGFAMSVLLQKHGLTLESKVRELPKEYHDNQIWKDNESPVFKGGIPNSKTRNDMTIKDYMENVAFRVYILDAQHVSSDFEQGRLDITGTVQEIDRKTFEIDLSKSENAESFFLNNTRWNEDELNFHWKLSRHLVTDVNTDHVAWATAYDATYTETNPFGTKVYYVPVSSGSTLDVEEIINPDTANAEYKLRIVFDTDKLLFKDNTDWSKPSDSIANDVIFVTVSLDRERFYYWKGSKTSESRTHKQFVDNLYRAFVAGNEVTVLAENFKRNLHKNGVVPAARPVHANDIADRIATNHLFQPTKSKTGVFVFHETTGILPDGIIESVNVSFDPEGGIREVVNLSSGWLDGKNALDSPFVIKQSVKLLVDEELRLPEQINFAQNWIDRDRISNMIQSIGSGYSPIANIKKLDGNLRTPGTSLVTVEPDVYKDQDIDAYDVVIIKRTA